MGDMMKIASSGEQAWNKRTPEEKEPIPIGIFIKRIEDVAMAKE